MQQEKIANLNRVLPTKGMTPTLSLSLSQAFSTSQQRRQTFSHDFLRLRQLLTHNLEMEVLAGSNVIL